jgi:hypothetical protein
LIRTSRTLHALAPSRLADHGLLLALVFLGMAAGVVVRGRFDDPETGLLERARNPVAFWLSALGLVLMGLYLLAVGLGPTLSWLAGPKR